MAEINNLFHRGSGHQAERSAGELERVNVSAHGFKDVLKIALAHGRVVRPADFSHPGSPRLRRPIVDSKEWKCAILVTSLHIAALPLPQHPPAPSPAQEARSGAERGSYRDFPQLRRSSP